MESNEIGKVFSKRDKFRAVDMRGLLVGEGIVDQAGNFCSGGRASTAFEHVCQASNEVFGIPSYPCWLAGGWMIRREIFALADAPLRFPTAFTLCLYGIEAGNRDIRCTSKEPV